MNTYTGQFAQNQANGACMIQFQNGSLYQGNVDKGIMHGKGHITSLSKEVYDGEFE